MKILFMIEYSHPGVLGGDATFGRNLKKMFQNNLYFLAGKIHNKIYFNLDNVIEIYGKSIIFKKINNLSKGYLKKYITSKNIKIIKPDICILNHPQSIEKMFNIENKKILVQHINYNMFISNFCDNNFKLIEKLKKELDLFVFLSEYDKKRFIEEMNFPKEKAVVIRHTSEMKLVQNKKEKNKKLIMITRLDNNHKRIDLAIQVMKKLPNFTLNIYGDGKDREYLENLIEENNLPNVFLHRGTSRVKEKLDENGIFVMTSDFEGYPITLIEAMRRGLPIVLRNTFDSACDIVQNNGILLNKEWNEEKFVKAVRKVYDNYDYYSENSIEMGKRYDFEVIKKEWSKLFDKILKKYT